MLNNVAEGVFDNAIEPRWRDEFFADPRHHLVVALEGDVVVGMISSVNYVHPDKAPQLFINEVGVAPAYQRQGIAKQMIAAMLEHGRALGCTEAWLGTEDDNTPANRLYLSADGKPDPTKFEIYTWDFG